MKVKRNNRGYAIFATDSEFAILEMMAAGFDIDVSWPKMERGPRRAWGQRIRKGAFLRIDQDKRTW